MKVKKNRWAWKKNFVLPGMVLLLAVSAVACKDNTINPAPVTVSEPSPTKEPMKQPEETEVIHSDTVLAAGDYLFYKTGKLTETVIVREDQRTNQVTELTAVEASRFDTGEFYLKGSNLYYHSDGDIYRVDTDGKNKLRLYKGSATILGIYEEDVIALDRKGRELIRIDPTGGKVTLTKLDSIDTLEAILLEDKIYYISKSSNNTENGNDPEDRLYYIDVNGKNKKEIAKALDIFDLKRNEKELFFLSISSEEDMMKVNRVQKGEVTALKSWRREELEIQGCDWFEENTFTLLAASDSQVYYGIDFNNGKDMNLYSIGRDGDKPELFMNAHDIKGIHSSAYFMKGRIDGRYLKVVFDCDEAPVEIHLLDLQDKSSIKLEGKYYNANSIDVEGEYIYYCKSLKPDPYGELSEEYEYGRSQIAGFR